MDVIEYGLGKQQRAEVYINRLLCYLLDPDQPHRMGSDFLETFLDSLPAACGFDEDTYDLTDVRVNEQVPVWDSLSAKRDAETSPGYLDLLLDVPHEWFLLIELEFSAEERGTESIVTRRNSVTDLSMNTGPGSTISICIRPTARKHAASAS